MCVIACMNLHKHTHTSTDTHMYRHTYTHVHIYICTDIHTHINKTRDTEIQTLTFVQGQPPSLLPTPSLWEVKRILSWVLFFLWHQRIYGVPPVQRCPTSQTQGLGFHTVKNRHSSAITSRDLECKPAIKSKSILDWGHTHTQNKQTSKQTNKNKTKQNKKIWPWGWTQRVVRQLQLSHPSA